jgi:hypothetical protein
MGDLDSGQNGGMENQVTSYNTIAGSCSAVRYDGTNDAELSALVPGVLIGVPNGSWLYVRGGLVFTCSDEQFRLQYAV